MSAIKVSSLIKLLKTLDPNLIVVLSKDSEGNSFSPMPNGAGFCESVYRPDSTWSGELVESEEGAKEKVELEKGDLPCVVFWPTN